MKGRPISRVLLLAAVVLCGSGGIARATLTEDFESRPGAPVWTVDSGEWWEFLDNVAGHGTVDNSLTGSILTGGPTGNYGRYDGLDGTGVSHYIVDQTFYGPISFNARIDAEPGDTGQVRFRMGFDAGEIGSTARPSMSLSVVDPNDPNSKLRLQLDRNNADGWVDNQTSLTAGQWYTYIFDYHRRSSTGEEPWWTLQIKDLGGNTVFDEGIRYPAAQAHFLYATWDKAPDPADGGPSPAWNIDQINPVPPRASDFGKQWLRTHPFTVAGAAMGISPTFDLDQYLAAGMTTVWANGTVRAPLAEAAAAAGVPWQMHGGSTTEPFTSQQRRLINNLLHYGEETGTAWMLPDEPSSGALDVLGQESQWLKRFHPELLVYVNVGNTSSGYVNDVMTKVKPDVLMFDAYPFLSDGSTNTNGWFGALMSIRNKARANDIPYWGWMQSFQMPGWNGRQPSESDLRYNAYTLLTAGYTGLVYFTYDHHMFGVTISSSFFDANGTPTSFYYYAADANAEIQNVGQALRFLTNTDVRFVRGSVSGTPSGLTNWSPGAGGDSHILSVGVDLSDPANWGSEKDGLIGFFTDDDGQLYFMLTNLYHAAGTSAAATALDFIIQFDVSIDELLWLNRETGLQELIALDNHFLRIELPGGTGELFKYNTGDFAGLSHTPEPGTLWLLALGGIALVRRRRRR